MKVKVELNNITSKYGDSPLGLKMGEVLETEMTNEISLLLRDGALKYHKSSVIPKEKFSFSIRGIGPKTMSDLDKDYDSEEDLVTALKNDKVGQRDDVVRKLKRYFKVF